MVSSTISGRGIRISPFVYFAICRTYPLFCPSNSLGLSGDDAARLTARSSGLAPLIFRHPPASRAFAAQTGGPSGARERDPVADSVFRQCAADGFRLTAPLGPPVASRRRMTKGGAGQALGLHRRSDPFSPCGRTQPSAARSDEGFYRPWRFRLNDPSSGPAGHLLPQGEKEEWVASGFGVTGV
jgi:hypothetical protein